MKLTLRLNGSGTVGSWNAGSIFPLAIKPDFVSVDEGQAQLDELVVQELIEASEAIWQGATLKVAWGKSRLERVASRLLVWSAGKRIRPVVETVVHVLGVRAAKDRRNVC